MFRISKAHMDMARIRPLRNLWRHRAMRHGLSHDKSEQLEQHVIHWIIEHNIEEPENVDFVMIATARSAGTFLTAEPVVEAMRIADHEGELAVSTIRREAMTYLQKPGA